MPKNFKNGKIYVVRNTVNDKVYVGSTTQGLSQRMGEHRTSTPYRCAVLLVKAMKEHGFEKFYIELLEKYPCENSEELKAREGYHIRRLETIDTNKGYNSSIAGRTHKMYLEDNKEKIQQQQKINGAKYYQNNKEKKDNVNKKYYTEHKEDITK